MTVPDLEPGDLLLFSRHSFFNWLIMVKTWSMVSHTEIYIGGGKTVAARNGKGAKVYDEDLRGLYCVLRPALPFGMAAALKVFYSKWDGLKYGWAALLNFITPVNLSQKDVFCSELSTMVYRAGGFEPFNSSIEADKVAPADFTYCHESVLKTVWRKS